MSSSKKRIYHSETREIQAAQTRKRILAAAKKLFQSEGFEKLTIEKLAQTAKVSAPTIYALFQSKRGVLLAVLDSALPSARHEALVAETKQEKSAPERLAIAAKISRQMYDAERAQMNVFPSAAIVAPEFKALEKQQEQRRYKRQEDSIKRMFKENLLTKALSLTQARDILWTFTGRDMYRMLVIERGWTSNNYEKWLKQLLIKTLLDE